MGKHTPSKLAILTDKVWWGLDSQIILPISFHERGPGTESKCDKENPRVIAFIKIMFAGKADNELSYLGAPAGGTDNNQHLQMYFSK